MRARLFALGFGLFLLSCHHAQPVPTPATAAPAPMPTAVPEGIDGSAIDWKANPCDDFFQYSCGSWLARTEIPADRSSWYIWSSLDEQNEMLLNRILQQIAGGTPPPGSVYTKQLGELYSTCMDEKQLEQSLPDLQQYLKPVEAIRTGADVPKVIAAMHHAGADPLFGFGSVQDYADATQMIGELDQGGLGLPDRDYYLSAEPKMKEVLGLYRQHVQNVFQLLGDPPAAAETKMKDVLELETQLAKASLDKVSRRDPLKIYHRMSRKQLASQAPGFPWARYLDSLKIPKDAPLDVTYVPFFQEVSRLVGATPAHVWRSYLTLRYVELFTPALPKSFEDEEFHFRSKALTGALQDEPRWKKCVHIADSLMGEALARPYVAMKFPEQAKQMAEHVVHAIESEFGDNLKSLTWMDEPTRKEAEKKLSTILNKIGYPTKWKSYDGLATNPHSFLSNYAHAVVYETERDWKKIGKPVDRTEWEMTPPTVNAYYEPTMNEVVLPAGILQPPLFSAAFTQAANFGGTGGGTVGHELTHGFDDEGRHFDEKGNLRDWWSKDALAAFQSKTQCVAKQYDQYIAIDDIHVNGELTTGEDVADLGGVKLGYHAMQRYLAEHPLKTWPYRLSPQQTYFVAFAQSWCAKIRPQSARSRAVSDPHAPAYWRVNGTLSDLPTFQEAFQCHAGDRMVPARRCEVW